MMAFGLILFLLSGGVFGYWYKEYFAPSQGSPDFDEFQEQTDTQDFIDVSSFDALPEIEQ